MKSKLLINNGGRDETVFVSNFPGGEVNVSLPNITINDNIFIKVWLHDSEGVIALAQLKSILDDMHIKNIKLLMGYVPYARQDRVCNKGESLAIKVFANLINEMNFSQVIIVDPHSDVTPALLNNVRIVDKSHIFHSRNIDLSKIDCLVAPDAGASKEVQKLCQYFNKSFIQGAKIRDPSTGELSGFSYQGNVAGKRLLIVDDICDGGGTFVGLASELKKGKPESIQLYVTHGMFTKGLNLLQSLFDRIYTTNTYISDIYKNAGVKCLYKLGEN